MSAVELQAKHLREWLKGSRIDGFTIDCVDFKTVNPDDDEVSYSIYVTARNPANETVGELAFKILYPFLKLYPCHLKPEAQGRGLTCQMYMVPMAFAAEDERITMVRAKQVDATLQTKFKFNSRGVLKLGQPGVRDELLRVMQKCYDESRSLVKSFTTRLARARVFAVTDGSSGTDWSHTDPNFVTIGPTSAATAGPFNMPLAEPRLWTTVGAKAAHVPDHWPTVVFDQLDSPIPDEVLSSAVGALVDRLAGRGGDVLVHSKTDPHVGHHLETHGYSKTTRCVNGVCQTLNQMCNNGQCDNQFYTYKLPASPELLRHAQPASALAEAPGLFEEAPAKAVATPTPAFSFP